MPGVHARLCGALASLGSAVVVNDLHAGHGNDRHLSIDKVNDTVIATEAMATLETLADTLMDPETKDVNIARALDAAGGAMSVQAAKHIIDQQSLPAEINQLVQSVGSGESETDAGFSAEFSEESLAKARRALNELVEKAWIELDDKIFKCKGFQEMNRENYDQVTRDIMRLIEQINDLERIESESVEGGVLKESEILDTEELLAKETKLYNIEYAENKQELTIRQNDLDVFQFILVFTKCKDATSLQQINARVCQMKNGRRTLLFEDSQTQQKYHQMLTPNTKKTLDRILRTIEGQNSFLQQPGNVTKLPPVVPVPVLGEDGASCATDVGSGRTDTCMKACNPDEAPDCALLHDKLSLMWGEFKDKVDELTMMMMKNEMSYTELKSNLNDQIQLLVKSKGRFSQLLAEARANMAADRSELKEKYSQKAKLDKQYVSYMAACKKRIQWIMYQDMCAIKIVRNAVLENSTTCPTEKIQDCDMDAWIPEQCSVSCDDSCDPSQPFKCGGWQKMTRKAVVPNDECGIKCPLAEKYKRCGQFPCPINCHMSAWSGWSKCTAECEGGIQSHTRSILMKPKNGGDVCNTVSEGRPCNTMSCDRDCKLQRWTKWSPCSVACAGGFQEKYKHVLIPTRGAGKCPKSESGQRYGMQACNTQDCNGDEYCVANQDLIIAIDGSGSLRQSGFDTLKTFVKTLLERYQTQYWGQQAVKLGIILFGNGVIMPDGKTVSPAINAQKLTFNLKKVNGAVEELPFKKGFTNMAQAFSLAEDMFTKGSRKGSQSAVMIVTDGKPSFKFMTTEMVDQLRDKSIMRYFFVVNEDGIESDSLQTMKGWASQPWETNLIHVKGLTLLDADVGVFAEQALVKFCPMAVSAMTQQYERSSYGYMLVKKGGWCGEKDEKRNLLSRQTFTPEACAVLAQERASWFSNGPNTFLLGVGVRKGWCLLGSLPVNDKLWNDWSETKADPKCPLGDWTNKLLYNFYAMAPVDNKGWGS